MAEEKTLFGNIQFRRATQAQWETVKDTFIPKQGEPCVTLDGDYAGQLKIGNGIDVWGQLKYVGTSEGAMHFKGTVATKADLPTDAKTGDIYQVEADNNLYIWNGTEWDDFHAVDLSNYVTNDKMNEAIDTAIEGAKSEIMEDVKSEISAEVGIPDGDTLEKTDDGKLRLAGIEGAKEGQVPIKNAEGGITWADAVEVIKIYGDSEESGGATIDGVAYDNVSDAINAAGEGATVKLDSGLANGEAINIDKELTLDLNESAIVDNNDTPITVGVNGDVTLTGNGSVECNKNGKPAVKNNGAMTIENGNYTRTVDEKGDTFYTMVNHGNLVINDGVFEAPGVVSSMIENGYYDYAKEYVAGQSSANPTLTVNGGTFINNFYAIKNDDAAILNINGGNFYGTIFHNGVSMTIKDGYFSIDEGTYNIGLRKLNEDLNPCNTVIEGGIFESNGTSNFKVNEGEPNVSIKGGKFNHEVPEAFIAEGYEQKLVGGYYVVSAKA